MDSIDDFKNELYSLERCQKLAHWLLKSNVAEEDADAVKEIFKKAEVINDKSRG